jgi:hypothetical protein
VTITRERWREIWLDPAGREVSGDELARLRAELASFPPPQRRGEPPWRLHFRGYEPETVLTRPLRTDEDGAAELRFEVTREGYYRIPRSGRGIFAIAEPVSRSSSMPAQWRWDALSRFCSTRPRRTATRSSAWRERTSTICAWSAWKAATG